MSDARHQDPRAWKELTDRNRETIERALQAFNDGAVEAFLGYFSDDMAFWMNGSHQFSGAVQGKEAFLELVGRVGEGLSKMITLDARNIIAGGEWVVVEASGDATTTDGEPYRNRYCMLWRLDDGKIVEFREYNDSHLVVEKFPR